MNPSLRLPAKVLLLLLLFLFSALLLLNGLLGVGETKMVEGTNSSSERILALVTVVGATVSFLFSFMLIPSNKQLHSIIAIVAILIAWLAFVLMRGFDASMDGVAFSIMAAMLALSKLVSSRF